MASLQSLVLCCLNKKLSPIGAARMCMNVGQPLSEQPQRRLSLPKQPLTSSSFSDRAGALGAPPQFMMEFWPVQIATSVCVHVHSGLVISRKWPLTDFLPVLWLLLSSSSSSSALWVLAGSGGHCVIRDAHSWPRTQSLLLYVLTSYESLH